MSAGERRPEKGGEDGDDDDLGPGDERDLHDRVRANVAERQARIHTEGILTAERTMLGWVRTGIQLMALGFMLSRFEILLTAGRFHMPAPSSSLLTSPFVGALVIGQGAAMCVISAIRYLRAHRAIVRGEAKTPDLGGPMAMAAGVVAMGAVIAALVLNIMSAAPP